MTTGKVLRAAMIGMRHGHQGGLGQEGAGYIQALRQCEGVEIVAYCEDTDTGLLDPVPELDPGASAYTSVDDLIAKEDFDVGWVVLPSNEIPAVGTKLADAGKHFFMEKQFARRATDLAPMVQAVRRSGVKVLPGYPWRFHPAIKDMRRIIEEGKLGRPLTVESRLSTRQVRPDGRDPTHFFYRDETEGGGMLHMLGGHHLEVMRFLMGCEVKAVQAMLGRPIGHIEEPLEDLAMVALEYENGAYGSIVTGYLSPPGLGGADVSSMSYRGQEGIAEAPIGPFADTLRVQSTSPEWTGAPEREFKYTHEAYDGYGGSRWMLEWIQAFIRALLEGREPALGADDALHVLETIDAAYESARTGRRVEVEHGV